MKSVLFISLMNGSAWGGSEELWYRTALWMSKNNYHVSICCYNWDEKKEQLDALRLSGCTIYLLPNKKGLFNKLAIKKTLRSIAFDKFGLVIVNQGGWEEILHSPFKTLYKRLPKYIILNHNYNEDAELSMSKKKLLQQWVMNAQMNFGATEKIFEVLEQKFNININKKNILLNPITFLPGFLPYPYPEISSDGFIWVVLAELDTGRKGQDVLIKVLSSSKWKERNWQLHLYGKGKDKEMLEKMILQLQMEKKVLLKGFTSNIKQTLIDCHLLLQCTRIDAMPISVVEAMAVGRPCLVSDVGDMPVWVNDTVTGFVCHKFSENKIDEALESCWQQKENWAAMGKNAFDTFLKKYPQPYEEKIADILNNYL